MMYNNKLAIAVKNNGKVLREFEDTVYVPFGCEYTLLIKNLNTVRVQVHVEVDGIDATDGCSLIIAPGDELELKRFIKGGNLNEGNAFKFIERTSGIEKHRGVGIQDGLIRVTYQFEQPYIIPTIYPTGKWVKKEFWDYEGPHHWKPYNTIATSATTGSTLRSMSQTASYSHPGVACSNSAQSLMNATSASINEVGITVPGSVNEQKFSIASSFAVEPVKHVMVIKLLGETKTGKPVQQPVTVKAKPKCITCGRVNKAKTRFCSDCGTSLEIV